MAKLTLVEARGLIGWSQTKLADVSGVKNSAISDIESGRNQNPGYTTVMRLVRALQSGGLQGVNAEDIFPVPQSEPAEVKSA